MQNEIIDQRDFGFFKVENELIDSEQFDVYEIAIYIALCRHGNNNKRKCYPSLNTLAKELNTTRPTIIKYLKKLQDKNLIRIKQVKSDNNGYDRNIYYIIGVVKDVNKGSKGVLQGVVKEFNKGSKGVLHKEEIIKKNNNKYIADFDELWTLYPRKKGKGSIINSNSKLEFISKNKAELKRCIARYSKEVEGKEQKYIMYGSTFFTTGYIDYLDNNYKEPVNKERYFELKKFVDRYGIEGLTDKAKTEWEGLKGYESS